MLEKEISSLVEQYKTDSEIYHDLMQFRVREILLVATVYDAYILEEEDKLTEKIFGEYHQLNLSTAPRITSVSFGEAALDILKKRTFDMAILTMRIDEISPFELSEKIKTLRPSLPVMLLLNDNNEISLLKDKGERLRYFDKIFVWNGDSKIFLAMIKYTEDKINVVKDTRIGLVRVILLVEDSIRYYSTYLPTLYAEIMKQTQRIMADEHLDEMNKLLRMRARPKVLMAENYEEAIYIFNQYREYLLCVISDVKFPLNGKKQDQAGLKLLRYVHNQTPDLPYMLQSFDPGNQGRAHRLRASFLDKTSEHLSRDLTEFIFNHLGFGDFVFRDDSGQPIARAQSMDDFKQQLATVPDESLVYHANRNHFSGWLMARGEIQIAKQLQPVKVSDFASCTDLREHLITVWKEVQERKTRGKVIQFSEGLLNGADQVIRLAEGSLGGKGRGMAFLHMLIQNCELNRLVPGMEVRIPQTLVVGTEEYDRFIEKNNLDDLFQKTEDYELVKQRILAGELSSTLRVKLRHFLTHADYPLSIRSSGLFEDSLSQPFAGIYDTYLLPNNHGEFAVRLRHLEQAIKLVYASIFSDSARCYFEAIHYKIGEEKMAVLIQGTVGNRCGKYFHPHLAGVAQSYNYYPVAYLKPEDGIAVIGVGLGKYVIDGERAFRFCPRHPRLEFLTPEEQLRNSQQYFYAVDMEESHIHLVRGDDSTLARINVNKAEPDPMLHYCFSVWDQANDRMLAGGNHPGPKVVNFPYLLKFDTIPLASTVEAVLDIVKSAMGTPVEIEFAVDLNKGRQGKPVFYILQIKPLLGDLEDYHLDLTGIDRRALFLYTERAMGNGKVSDLCDIIYVEPERFDRAKTREMSRELEGLNAALRAEDRRYILIGPGRWGSRDPWLGIPVNWAQISNAKIIVEVELEDFQVDPSLGSHFFHNVTSMNVGYFDIPHASDTNCIDWSWLRGRKIHQRTKYFNHVRLGKPLIVKMDGRRGISIIYKDNA